MDDNSGNTTDKRNWRERLGIGKTAGSAELPKLAGDFKTVDAMGEKLLQPVASPAKPTESRTTANTPVKAAPMAPRAAPKPAAPTNATSQKPTLGTSAKPITARPAPVVAAAKPAVVSSKPTAAVVAPRSAAPRQPPVPTDTLANKLKDQREAAERLALQRVQAAKQKAEANLSAGGATARPKFSFADDTSAQLPQAPASPAIQHRAIAQPALPTQQAAFGAPSPHLQPARPQLGAGAGFGAPPVFPQQGQTYAPTGNYQQNFGYQPSTSYRPIDPNTGYVPPPSQAYIPPTARPAYQPTAPQPAQRVAPPPRGPMAPIAPRAPHVALGPAGGRALDNDDVFEPAPMRAAPRRATANEYQQAYRDELSYEDEAPRSRGLGALLGILLLGLLVTFGTIYGYAHYFKGAKTASGTVPVVAAPATPTKAVPDATTAQGQVDQANKKQIYDRIEGDHEVPGGPLKSTEEAPVIQPGGAQINSTGPTPLAPKATGGDGTPLPLPPPPGGGTGQQGALAPDSKSDVATIEPAAGQSSAANSSAPIADPTNTTVADVKPAADLPLPVPEPPVAAQAMPINNKPADATAANQVAAISQPAPAALPKPLATKPTPLADTTDNPTPTPIKPVKKKDALKNLVLRKSLGARPVVLVPPGKAKVPAAPKVASAVPSPVITTGSNSLYGETPVATTQPRLLAPAPAAPITKLAATAPPAVATPAVPAGNAYVVQLASFNSKAEANAEYQRLSSKHGAIITRYAPIIAQAQVAGSTRYKLNLGPMASNDAASSVCSALISAGERDCVVRRQ